MNLNLGNVNIKRTVSKYISVTPFNDTILCAVKGLSNKEVSNSKSLRQVDQSNITMFKQN